MSMTRAMLTTKDGESGPGKVPYYVTRLNENADYEGFMRKAQPYQSIC
jgi:hypothetical protein